MSAREFNFNSRALCVHYYGVGPFWFFAVQVGWRGWRWWEVVVGHDGAKFAHLDLRGFSK